MNPKFAIRRIGRQKLVCAKGERIQRSTSQNTTQSIHNAIDSESFREKWSKKLKFEERVVQRIPIVCQRVDIETLIVCIVKQIVITPRPLCSSLCASHHILKQSKAEAFGIANNSIKDFDITEDSTSHINVRLIGYLWIWVCDWVCKSCRSHIELAKDHTVRFRDYLRYWLIWAISDNKRKIWVSFSVIDQGAVE
jgi:hypothetical protein